MAGMSKNKKASQELEKHLKGLGLKYTKDSEGNYELNYSLKGEIKNVNVAIIVRDKFITINATSDNPDVRFDEHDERLVKCVAEYLNRVNYITRIGSFMLFYDGGMFYYFILCDIKSHIPSQPLINLYLTDCCERIAKWMPGFIAVVKRGVDPKTAFECCRDGKPLPDAGKPVSRTGAGVDKGGGTPSGNTSGTDSRRTGSTGTSGTGSRRAGSTGVSGSPGQGPSSGAPSGNRGQSGRKSLPSGSAGSGRSGGTVSSSGAGSSSRGASTIDLGIVVRDYPQCLENRLRLRGLLMDLYVSQTRQINLAMYVYDSGILEEIRKGQNADLRQQGRWVTILMDDYGISEEYAKDAVGMWLSALNRG